MKANRKSLSKIIVKNSIRIFVISIIVLLSVILYFFQKEIMYSSVIYGDLALKNSALSIEKDNAEYVSLIENTEQTISFQLSSEDKEFDPQNTIHYLSDLLKQKQHLKGTFVAIEPEYLNDNHQNTNLNEAGKLSVYITKENVYPLQNLPEKAYYNTPKETLQSFITNPYSRKIGEQNFKVYSIVYPITINGNFAGIVGCDVDMKAIYEQLEKVEIYDGNSSVALLDNNGIYLTHNFHPELIGKSLAEDCINPDVRLKKLREGKIDNWFEGAVGSITNPIYFNDHQNPWQLQARVHAKYVFSNVITAAYWIIPTIILAILFFIYNKPQMFSKLPMQLNNSMREHREMPPRLKSWQARLKN